MTFFPPDTPKSEFDWTAERVAAIVAQKCFFRDVVCPNCTWTNHEADLLVVHHSMRLIDVEIKLSRADLKADAKKMKWWCSWPEESGRSDMNVPRLWPPKIWKHYIAMPAAIWKDEYLDLVPPMSGVMVILPLGADHTVHHFKLAKANKLAEPVTAPQAMNIARLASLRYWQLLAGSANRWKQTA